MKEGSLVTTNYPTELFLKDAKNLNSYFTPNPPVPGEVYVCKAIYPHPIERYKGTMVIELEEIQYKSNHPQGCSWMNARMWREVSPPLDLEALMEEVKEFELVELK